jgi:hypothetical protein
MKRDLPENIMNKSLALLLLLAFLSGCSTPFTPNYDQRFGDAVRQAKQQMIINPTPSTNPIMGIDGNAAAASVGRYKDSFKAPPPVVNVINIGGALGGGGQ